MKTIKGIIATGIIIFCNAFCNAQQIQLTHSQIIEIEKQTIDSSGYIFEGTVAQQSTFNRTLVTCSVIQITRIYKGSPQIKLGTIKVITEQGPNTQDADPGLYKGSNYIIFGIYRTHDTNYFHSIIADNPLPFWALDYRMFHGKHTRAQWDTAQAKSDNIYGLLKQAGLTVQQEVEQTTMPADSTK